MNTNVKEITKQLEEGVKDIFVSGCYEEYLQFMSKFHHYSFNNIVLILMQKPNASLVAGYKAWQSKFHRFVKKGEKGITILAPVPHKGKRTITDASGIEVEESFNYTTYKAVTVFDISQTDGDDIPTVQQCEELKGRVKNYKGLLSKLEKVAPCPIAFEEIKNGANGYFVPSQNRIAIKKGMSQKQTVKTMIHEISHAMLHGTTGEQKDVDRETMEVQAESVAYTVCNMLGMDTKDYSFGYVAGWSTGRDLKELMASMEVIRKTATKMVEALGVA